MWSRLFWFIVGFVICVADGTYIKLKDGYIRQHRGVKFFCTYTFLFGIILWIVGIIYAIIV